MYRKLVLAALLSAAVNGTASAQVGLGRIKEAAKKAMSASDSAKRKADSSKTKTDSARLPSTSKGDTAKPAPVASSVSATAQASPPANAKVWENYDFVPGSKVLFYTDFSEDRTGNFARGLKYVSGAMDVVERDDVKMLRASAPSTLLIPVGRKLPQRFTLEIDVLSPPSGTGGFDLVSMEGGAARDRGKLSAEVEWNTQHMAILGGGQSIGTSQLHLNADEGANYNGRIAHIRILMDSGYFKMYANEKRLYNIPELAFKRDTVIRVALRGGEDKLAVFVTSIRVAESETDVLYDALANKGRWATQGILFETGKAELRPESRPVLKEIASTMKKYGDLKILIEGHTDNVGSAASNLTLSDARAAAVKAALAADFGVAADRITTKGLGDTKPSVPNSSAVGRAQNRRVEIVKQ